MCANYHNRTKDPAHRTGQKALTISDHIRLTIRMHRTPALMMLPAHPLVGARRHRQAREQRAAGVPNLRYAVRTPVAKSQA